MFGDDTLITGIFHHFAKIREQRVRRDTRWTECGSKLAEWASNLAQCCTSVRACNGKGTMVGSDRIFTDLSQCFAMFLEGSVSEDTNFQECASNLPECCEFFWQTWLGRKNAEKKFSLAAPCRLTENFSSIQPCRQLDLAGSGTNLPECCTHVRASNGKQIEQQCRGVTATLYFLA